jgi:hypothetical protein
MARNIQLVVPNGQNPGVTLDDFPRTCPICHHAVDAVFIHARSARDWPVMEFDAVFQCTERKDCGRLFIGRYRTDAAGATAFTLYASVPAYPQLADFSAEIKEVSPTFVTIFNQAVAAEAAELDQLTGIGLRKALEFLVKDFAINQNAGKGAEAVEKIKGMWLGNVIDTHIADASVKAAAAAKRAAWLGNDETHYVRVWEDQDISDLKTLIRLTVNAVENVLLLKRYEKAMPDRTTT